MDVEAFNAELRRRTTVLAEEQIDSLRRIGRSADSSAKRLDRLAASEEARARLHNARHPFAICGIIKR